MLQIHKIYEGENNIYCVGDHYSGGTLYSYIKEHGKPTETNSINIVRQLLEALRYLEQENLIHRDIKPENIIFDTDAQVSVTLVDFGFMTRTSEFRKLFTRCGTPGYVAPEVLADKEYNTKADVYSMGLLFYILVSNANPFYSTSYSRLIHKNKSGVVDFTVFEELELTQKSESSSTFYQLSKCSSACSRKIRRREQAPPIS